MRVRHRAAMSTPGAAVFGLVACLAGAPLMATGPAVAQEVTFPAGQFGRANLATPQKLESLIVSNTGGFESVKDFTIGNRYRRFSSPVGRLDLLVQETGGAGSISSRQAKQFVSVCTAWVVSPQYIVTNHHCVPSDPGRSVVKAELRLGYLSELDEPGETFTVLMPPAEADAAMDYAILEVEGNPAAKYGVIPINPRDPAPGEELFILHHPGGKPLRLTRAKCRAITDGTFTESDLRHQCDTLVGSSGAPVFSDNDESVVGLHYLGGRTDRESGGFNSAKRLTALVRHSAILRDLAVDLPSDDPTERPGEPMGLSLTGRAAGPPIHDCDRMAAHPDDSQRVTAGVWWRDMEAPKAVAACRAAVRTYADTPRFKFQLGRALDRAGDREEAATWYRAAGEEGYGQAQYSMGTVYEEGLGVSPNLQEAARWYRKAADQGHYVARSALERIVPKLQRQTASVAQPAVGEPESVALVHDCDLLAAHPDDPQRVSAGVAWDAMRPDRAVPACEEALDEFPGTTRFKYQLGRAYDRGGNTVSAVKWYRVAADRGYPQALYSMGGIFRLGNGVPRNLEESARWYAEAAQNGHPLATISLLDLARIGVLDAKQALRDRGLE